MELIRCYPPQVQVPQTRGMMRTQKLATVPKIEGNATDGDLSSA